MSVSDGWSYGMTPCSWVRFVGDDTWTLSSRRQGLWTFYTLEGPHPAPAWTTGTLINRPLEDIMSQADDRIRQHYAVD